MNYSVMTERETEIELGTSAEEGISSFTAHDRLIENGRNMPEKKYAPGVSSLIVAQIKNLYTILFVSMAIITLVLDFKGEVFSWILFLLIAIANVILGFRSDERERRAAKRFDERRADEVRIIRDGKNMVSDPTLIVKGDVILLSSGDFVPADARILSCEDLKVDEAIFRRSSVPVEKRSEKMEYEGEITETFNMLYCGSVIAQGSVKAAVTATGKDTQLARLTESRSKKLNLHDEFAKNSPTEKMLALMAIISAAIIMTVVSIRSASPKLGLTAAVASALCLLPAPMRVVRMLAMKLRSHEIRKGGAGFEEKYFVYDIGSIDTLLIDKGKMLTDSVLKLEETVSGNEHAVELAALCSECDITEIGAKGQDLDAAAVNAAFAAGIDVKKLREDNGRLLFMPFDESRKLMASVHRKKGGGFILIVKGAIEAVPMLCSKIAVKGEVNALDGEGLHKIETDYSSMAERGLKVRAVAHKELLNVPENIEDELFDMTFDALFGYREIMAPKAAGAISSLKESFVRPIVVTGDNIITAAALAKEAKLIKSEDECISFIDIADISDEELFEKLKHISVFADASKKDRIRLLTVLSRAGKITAAAGDQMTAPSVAMCANVSFGRTDDEAEYDVSLKRANLDSISRIISSCRIMRSNMSAASCLAVSLGIAQVMTFIFLAITQSELEVSLLRTQLLNLFIYFLPCLALGLFGHTYFAERGRMAAVRCALYGIWGALFALPVAALSSFDALIGYFAFYAIFSAALMSFSRLGRKYDKDDFFIILMLLASSVGAAFFSAVSSVIFALIAAFISTVLSTVRLRRKHNAKL